jgi:hypothetical protein
VRRFDAIGEPLDGDPAIFVYFSAPLLGTTGAAFSVAITAGIGSA